MFFNNYSGWYQHVNIFITVSMFKNVKFFKQNWFLSLLFPLPEGSQASIAPQFRRLENRFLLLFEARCVIVVLV
jgi:hypothetical protein